MRTYPQKSVCVNNYYYFYIYIFRVNHKPKNHTPTPLKTAIPYTCLANNQSQPEQICLHNAKIPGRLRISVFRRRLITGQLFMTALAIAVVVSQFRTSYIERELSVQSQTEHYVKAMEAHFFIRFNRWTCR